MSKEHFHKGFNQDPMQSNDGSEASHLDGRLEGPAQTLEEAHQHALGRIRSYPAVTHVAFVSLILVPIAALPYIASRRRFHELKRQIKALQLDSRTFKLELDSTFERQRVTYESRIKELELVNARTSKDLHNLRDVMEQQNMEKTNHVAELRVDVQQALNETRQSRWVISRLFDDLRNNIDVRTV